MRHERKLEPVELLVPEGLLRQPGRPATVGGGLAPASCGVGDAGGPHLAEDGPAGGFRDRAATPLDTRPPEEFSELGGREPKGVDDPSAMAAIRPTCKSPLDYA